MVEINQFGAKKNFIRKWDYKKTMNREDYTKETNKHIDTVQHFMSVIINQLLERAHLHDRSKLENPEAKIFMEYTPKLKNSTYGSDEYNNFLKGMQVALDHHYENNRHHPDHFKNGIQDMNLVDLIEMICDWKAATLRHNNGNIFKSIEISQERFKFSDEIKQILLNTAELL